MLPRGAELARVFQVRQRFLGRSLSMTRNCIKTARSESNTQAQNASKNVTIQNSVNILYSSTSRRHYSKKEKIVAAAIKPNVSAQTKTTETTAKEPIPKQPLESTSNLITDKHETKLPAPTKLKKFELETPKGILSITTTIEDSKINEIIFEKLKSSKMKLPVSAVTLSNEDVPEKLKKPKVELASTVAVSDTKPLPKPAILKVQQQIREKIQAVAAAAMPATKIESLSDIPKPPLETKPPKPTRVRLDLNRSSLERNFITPARAMSDFLLKPTDLETLPKIKRRSPYEQEPPMTVFWRKDVETKAIEVWGSRENLLKETLKREVERKKHQQNIFTVKRRLRDYRREVGARTLPYDGEPGLLGHSGKVVLTAIGINCANFMFKVGGWLYSGSHSMFAEAIHSLADTVNQIILAYGIHKSFQSADSDHPYGYSNMRYVSALISGVGIFCVGSGLSIYHGITGLMSPQPAEDFFWAFFILGGSFVSEGATLLVAINELKRAAKLRGISFKEYVLSGKDPCVNVVLAEDSAAVSSVFVAITCMGLTSVTGNPVFDAAGSLLVGGILGAVASFIIYSNAAALVGKSIPEDQLNKINGELESDIMIRAIHDVKGIDIGSALVRYKAELDFDGRELTRSYLDKQDIVELLRIVKAFQTPEQLEEFLLNHGENIVDLMGGEIDRIEMKLRKKFPEIRHCDLEVL